MGGDLVVDDLVLLAARLLHEQRLLCIRLHAPQVGFRVEVTLNLLTGSQDAVTPSRHIHRTEHASVECHTRGRPCLPRPGAWRQGAWGLQALSTRLGDDCLALRSARRRQHTLCHDIRIDTAALRQRCLPQALCGAREDILAVEGTTRCVSNSDRWFSSLEWIGELPSKRRQERVHTRPLYGNVIGRRWCAPALRCSRSQLRPGLSAAAWCMHSLLSTRSCC